jgi:hypothetical protein
MDISNKTLAMFLVAAIVVSIAGTTISLNRMSTIGDKGPTGFASTGVGNVTLNVGSTLSIILDDNLIDFGTCIPGGTDVYIVSSIANGSATQNCNGPLPDQIEIRNDGNIDANISMNASDRGQADGGTFLTSAATTSRIRVRVTNDSNTGSYNGGCLKGMPSGYVTLTGANYQNYDLCQRLDAHVTDNSIAINVNITLPQGTTTGDFIEFDIWATASS